jgi:hypothetical protein
MQVAVEVGNPMLALGRQLQKSNRVLNIGFDLQLVEFCVHAGQVRRIHAAELLGYSISACSAFSFR